MDKNQEIFIYKLHNIWLFYVKKGYEMFNFT